MSSRWIKRTLAVLLLILLSGLVFLSSSPGLRFLVATFKHYNPGALHYTHIQGKLFKDITIDNLSYRSKTLSLSAQKIYMSWAPLALFKHVLHIHYLLAKQLTFSWTKSSHHQTHQATPALFLKVDHIQLTDSTLNINQKKYHLPMLTSSINYTKKHINVAFQGTLNSPSKLIASLHIKGTPAHYTLAAGLITPSGQWHASGTGQHQHVQLALQRSRFYQGWISGHAALQLPDFSHWTTTLALKSVRLKKWYNNLPKTLSFSLHATHSPNLTQAQLRNVNAQYPKDQLHGYASMQYDTPTHFQLHISLQSQKTLLDAHLRLHQQRWQGKWTLHIHQLNSLYPSIHGQIDSTGNISGAQDNPNSYGSLAMNHVAFGHTDIQSGSLHWAIRQQSNSLITANFKQVSEQAAHLQALKLSLQGDKNQHHFSLSSDLNAHTHLHLNGSGQWQKGQWQGHLSHCTLKTSQRGAWTLAQPVSFSASPHSIAYSQFTWMHGKQFIKSYLRTQAHNHWRFQLNSSPLSWHLLTGILPSALNPSGQVSLTLQAKGQGLAVKQATGEINANGTQLLTMQNSHAIQLKKAQLAFSVYKHTFLGSLQLKQNPGTAFSMQVSAPHFSLKHFSLAKQTVSSHATLLVQSLTPYANLCPNSISHISGNVHGSWHITGTLAQPNIIGNMRLQNASLQLNTLNTSWSHIQANIQAKANRLYYTAHINNPTDALAISGILYRADNTLHSLTHINGKNLPLMNTYDYQINASPKLTLRSTNAALHLTGQVTLPKASFHIRDMRSVTTLPRNNIVYFHQGKHQKGLQISSYVKVIAGKNVHLNAYGIRGQLSGSLMLSQAPNKASTATGNISLSHGSYQAYGQALKITQAQVNYAKSALTNPNINLLATRTIGGNNPLQSSSNTITVGVKLNGPLSEPALTLFSSPNTLTQTDILSYLLLGHASHPNSTDKLSLALQALSALKLGQVNPITQLKRSLGINELGIETQDTIDAMGNTTEQSSAFVVGKYITPKLYVRYSSALSTSILTLEIQYFLNPRWSIQTSTSSQNQGSGIDMLYSFNY